VVRPDHHSDAASPRLNKGDFSGKIHVVHGKIFLDQGTLMRDLHGMSIGQRVMATVIIVVIIMLILAAIGYLSGRWEEAGAAPGTTEAPPIASKWDDHIDELERQALDDAFKKYIGQLYNIWVTDNYQPKFPPKALTGARNARDAYIRSMEAIEKREHPPRR
jgi:hypothetical protein